MVEQVLKFPETLPSVRRVVVALSVVFVFRVQVWFFLLGDMVARNFQGMFPNCRNIGFFPKSISRAVNGYNFVIGCGSRFRPGNRFLS